MNIVLSILGGIVIYFTYLFFRIKFLVARTDKVIKDNFSLNELFTDKKYTKPLLVIAGDRVLVMRPLKYFQIYKMMQLLLLEGDIDLDKLIRDDRFYPALAYVFLRNGEDIAKLIHFLRNTITYKQIIRIIQVVMLQNNLSLFNVIYKELKNG